DPNIDPTAPDFASFQTANLLLGKRCAAGNCHGATFNSLHLTCGDTPEQKRWNYFAIGDYVATTASASEMLLRTLSPAAGGAYHEGGAIFEDTTDPDYKILLDWATAKGGPTHTANTDEFKFFADRVQPMLVKRGCMMLGCHSASMFHDYRLRGGSNGHFGYSA